MNVLQLLSILDAGKSQPRRNLPSIYLSGLLFLGIAFASSILGTEVVDAVAEAANPPATDLYGDTLPPGAISRLGTTRLRQGSRVGSLQYTRDGRLLFSRSGTWFCVWAAESGQLLRRENLQGLFTLRVSDDTLMLARDKSEPLQAWKFTDPKDFPPKIVREEREGEEALFNIPAPAGAPRRDNPRLGHFTISPDGKTLATATQGQLQVPRQIQLWKFEPGKKLTELEPLGMEWTSATAIEDLIFSDDGQRLVAITELEGAVPPGREKLAAKFVTVMVCDVRNGTHASMLVPRPARLNVRGFAVSPDGQRFAIGTSDSKVLIYDVAEEQELQEIAVPQPISKKQSPVTVLTFSPDGKQLAGSGRDRKIWIWDVETGRLQREIEGHRSWIEQLDYSPDGKTLASGAQDGAIHLWNVATGQRKDPERGHGYWLLGGSLSADG